jgi:hypothetical protein
MTGVERARLEGAWRWIRAEHAALVLALSTLVLMHAAEVAWGRFVGAFALIDLVGYLPGAIAFRRARGRPIAPAYHHLYNLTHNYLVAAAAVACWALAGGGPEWAMLAVPIHLSGDRGIFGTFARPVSQPFEPPPRGSEAEAW